MKRITQKERVKQQLKQDGFITNLWCIEHGIWRLGAIIHNLRLDGYKIDGDFIAGTKNYKYILIEAKSRTIQVRDNDALPPIKINGRWIPQPIYKKEKIYA